MKQVHDISLPIVAGGSSPGQSTLRYHQMASPLAGRPIKETARHSNNMLYPLDMPVRYEVLGRPSASGPLLGSGRTTRVGSRVVVFWSDQTLEVNRKIRFALDWPVSLPDGVALKLWAFGTVVDVDSNMVSVVFSGSEFRTSGRPNAEVRQ